MVLKRLLLTLMVSFINIGHDIPLILNVQKFSKSMLGEGHNNLYNTINESLHFQVRV